MMMGPRAGLYLRDDRLTVVLVSGRRGGVQCFALEPGDLPGARIKSELETRQLRPRRMRIGLARPLLTVKVLELPPLGQGQLSEMVAFELERHVPFPPEDMRFDFVQLPAADTNAPARILVAAAERRTVESALRLLEEPRLKPGALTVACHDLPALLRRGSKTGSVVWAHRASGATDLLCLDQGRLELSRTVPVKDAAELAREINATLHVLGWQECGAVWISGDDAADTVAAAELQQWGAPVSEPPWRPAALALIQTLPEEDFGGAMLALAVALGSKRPALNLLARELRPRTLSTGQLVTAGTATVAVLLGLGLLVGQGYQQHRYAERLSQAIRALDPEVRTVEALSADLNQKRRLLEAVRNIEKTDVRALPVLKELTERIPAEAWLRTLTMDKQGMEITGQATAANQLIPLLENSPSLTRVEFTAPVTKAGDKEQFRIKAAWKPAPKPAPEPGAKPQTAPAPPPPAATRPPGARTQPPGAPVR
jgi:general secretion pathway protein L